MAVQEHTGWERKNSMNKIAILDAATQSVQYQDDDGTEYGRGLAVKLLKQYMADNVFVITPGLLTGTPVVLRGQQLLGKVKKNGRFVSATFQETFHKNWLLCIYQVL